MTGLGDAEFVGANNEIMRPLWIFHDHRMQLVSQRLHISTDMSEHAFAVIARGQQSFHVLHDKRRRPEHFDEPQIALVERLLDVLFEPVLIMGTTSAPDERIRLAWRTTDQHERTVIPLQTFLCHLDELIITLFEGSLDCLGFGCSPLFWMRILQSFEILTGRSSEIVDVILGQPSIRIHKTASERAQPQCGMRSTLHLYRHDGAEHRLIVFITQGRESFAHTAWSRKQVYDRYWIHGHSKNSLN